MAENILISNGQLIDSLQGALNHSQVGLNQVPNLVKSVIENNSWVKWLEPITGRVYEYKSFEEFVTAKNPGGLGSSIETLHKLCFGISELNEMIDEAVVKPVGAPEGNENYKGGKGELISDIVTNYPTYKDPRGNSPGYKMRRLHKDAPEIYQKVLSGEIKSPHAGMIAAGFKVKSVSVKLEVHSAARTLKKVFTKDELAELAEELLT